MLETIETADAYNSANANSQVVRHGDTLYVSGQVPKDATTGEIVGDEVATQTDQVFRNIEAILSAASTDLDNVIKATVYLQDKADYATFNDAYHEHVSEPYAGRTTVESAASRSRC